MRPNTLVVYDSRYGNTERIAQAMGQAIDARAVRVGAVDPAELKGLDVLIVGSPTNGGNPTQGIYDLLQALKAPPALQGVSVAAFDTRTATVWNRLIPFGYAGPRVARLLEAAGGKLLAGPEGFVVLAIKGPLQDGEIERAAEWAEGLVGSRQGDAAPGGDGRWG